MSDYINDVAAMLKGEDPSINDGWDESDDIAQEPHTPFRRQPGQDDNWTLNQNIAFRAPATERPKPDLETINALAAEVVAEVVDGLTPTEVELATVEQHTEADHAEAYDRTMELLTPGSHKERERKEIERQDAERFAPEPEQYQDEPEYEAVAYEPAEPVEVEQAETQEDYGFGPMPSGQAVASAGAMEALNDDEDDTY